MKRPMLALATLVLALASAGCLSVTAKDNRFDNGWDAVSHNGGLYLVNTSTGEIRSLPMPAGGAAVFTR